MSKTDFQEAANLNALSGLYLGILVGASDPSVASLEAGSATEASYAGYARQAVTLGTEGGSGDDSSTPSSRANTNVITFPAVAGADIKVRRFGYFDALSGGHMLYFTDTDLAKDVAVGVQPTVAVGAATISEK